MLLQIRYQSDGQHSDRRTYDYSGNRKVSTKNLIHHFEKQKLRYQSKKSGKRDLLCNGR